MVSTAIRTTGVFLMGVGLSLVGVRLAEAAAPTGHVDAIQADLIGGWARDEDNTNPIPVHIYIDGKLAHAMLANEHRPDLPYADQNHGFTWVPPLLGPGTHQVVVYAIGVNGSGVPDGENPFLPGSPGNIADGCNGFSAPANDWCQGVPNYYINRASDTHYLYNDNMKVGVNESFGGTILELYGPDHSFNLLSEHGGGAVQLSVWGYEPVGPDAYFAEGSGVCDPQPYATLNDCLNAGHASCRLWCCSQGAHVANCGSVDSCVGWGAGAPFNPIQAQAANCGWDSTTNDVDQVTLGSGTVFMRKSGPYHFTKSNSMPNMTFEIEATLHDAFVELDYRVAYSGPYNLTAHPQEIPAVFPGPGMNHTYYYYTGSAPYTDPTGPVTTVTAPASGRMLRLQNRAPYPHSNHDDYLTEYWVTACNSALSRCLTVAVFSPQYREIDCAAYPGNGYGYLTPLGGFPIAAGMDEQFTAYLFPFKYDQVVAGQTVREWIHQIAQGYGCDIYGPPCNDGNQCTHTDICQGDGTCGGTAYTCNDGNVCTDDLCNGDSTCSFVNNTNSCDDQDPCTTNDRCQNGICSGTPDPSCTPPDGGLPDGSTPDGGTSADGSSGIDAAGSGEGGILSDGRVPEDGGEDDVIGVKGGCECRSGGPVPSAPTLPFLLVLFSLAVAMRGRRPKSG